MAILTTLSRKEGSKESRAYFLIRPNGIWDGSFGHAGSMPLRLNVMYASFGPKLDFKAQSHPFACFTFASASLAPARSY